jgi:hypothetical protein
VLERESEGAVVSVGESYRALESVCHVHEIGGVDFVAWCHESRRDYFCGDKGVMEVIS